MSKVRCSTVYIKVYIQFIYCAPVYGPKMILKTICASVGIENSRIQKFPLGKG